MEYFHREAKDIDISTIPLFIQENTARQQNAIQYLIS